MIAVDLRGMGESDKPSAGYDKKTMARDVYELLTLLGYDDAYIAGEDIGSMVAYSFAANHPEATRKLALWEVGSPGELFNSMPLLPQPGQASPWWFSFNQVEGLPEALLADRFRLVVDWLIDHQASDPDAIDEASRAGPSTPRPTSSLVLHGRATTGTGPSPRTSPTLPTTRS